MIGRARRCCTSVALASPAMRDKRSNCAAAHVTGSMPSGMDPVDCTGALRSLGALASVARAEPSATSRCQKASSSMRFGLYPARNRRT